MKKFSLFFANFPKYCPYHESCHTLILDLKILIQISFLSLTLFNSLCFTLQFSTVLQLHIFTISVFNFLAYKVIQSAFLALQVIWKFLNHCTFPCILIPKHLHENHTERVFWSFPAVEPILVPTFVSESFQRVCTNHLLNSVWKSFSALHLSQSESF